MCVVLPGSCHREGVGAVSPQEVLGASPRTTTGARHRRNSAGGGGDARGVQGFSVNHRGLDWEGWTVFFLLFSLSLT